MVRYDCSESFTKACGRLGIDSRLVKAASKMNFTKLTMIQRKSIPLALQGKDLLLRAETGSGKTACYCLPLLQRILLKKGRSNLKRSVSALVLVPTRELCSQIHTQMCKFTKFCSNIVTVLSLSTEDIGSQLVWLRELPDILISTPLRAAKHIRRGALDVSAVDTFVLDEADMVLSYGYEDDVKYITKCLPKTVQSLLVSATFSKNLQSLQATALREPLLVCQEADSEANDLKEFYLTVPKADKDLVLFAFIKLGLVVGKTLIFVNDIVACYRTKLTLEQFGIHAGILSPELPYNSRIHILKEFNKGVFDILISTDLSLDPGLSIKAKTQSEGHEPGQCVQGGPNSIGASSHHRLPDGDDMREVVDTYRSPGTDAEFGVSRGIDFQGVKVVLNLDFPASPDCYVHRIGRTARGGACGIAISFLEEENEYEKKTLTALQKERKNSPTNRKSGNAINGQPTPLQFRVEDVEGFRYRFEDTKRLVTRIAIKNARLIDLKQEMLNSSRLKNYFKNNPQDLQVIQHAGSSRLLPLKPHLRSVPGYLIPFDMKKKTRSSRSRKRKFSQAHSGSVRKKEEGDPLKSYSYSTESSFCADESANASLNREEEKEKSETVTNQYATTGRHKNWQRNRRKGKFSKNYVHKNVTSRRLGINYGFSSVIGLLK
jgi:ATP-dependent RNA helicase DDX56/DBP9